MNTSEKNRKAYNHISTDWVEAREKDKVSNIVIGFCNKLKPGGKVLDIGCGTGYPIAKYLLGEAYTV
ncbi:hypothetical protein FACS1894110_00610 [Spirochaetia bacterium]|nr:hypothetical protein FACS1894110_00610 [Spirochaetia bacterium]